jgi:small conductance mechanosensitive channel
LQSNIGSLLIVVVALISMYGNPVSAQTPVTAAAQEMSKAEVDDLIRLLEDEASRASFLRRLKVLSQLQADTLAPQPPRTEGFLPSIILSVEGAIQQALSTSQNVFAWLARTPQHLRSLWIVLNDPAMYRLQVRNLRHLAFSLLPAAIVLLLLQQVLRPLTRLTLPARLWPVVQRSLQALLSVTLSVIPALGFLVMTVVLLGMLGAPPMLQTTARFLLSVVLLYLIITRCTRLTLAPDDPDRRLLPLSDEMANYLWIWVRRFLLFSIIYALLLYGLTLLYADPRSFQGVRGLLLCGFPTLITVFVAQLARQRVHPTKIPMPESGKRVLMTTRRVLRTLWPVLTVLYAWALTILIISRHAGSVNFLVWASVKTLIAVFGLLIALGLFNRLFDRLFRISDQIRQRFPLLEERANRYLKIMRDVCNGLLVLLALGMVFEFWGLPMSWFLVTPVGRQLLARVLIISLAIGLTGIAIGMSKTIADVLLQTKVDAQGTVHEPSRKRKTLIPLAHALLKVAIMFVAILVVLEQLGVNTGPVLAGVGILGLAIGFGAQSLVKDVINGLFILFEDSLSVGDVAMLRGTGGLVEKVTLRAVTLRDLSGNVHVIPNSSIDMVTNMTKEYSRYVLDVGVAYREDVDEVIGILQEIDAEMRADPEYSDDMLEPIEILGLDRFADSAIVVRARLKTKPIRQWRVGREFNRRMKKLFDVRGIEIPFPHRTLYWGMPKAAPQEPVRVSMDERQKMQQAD